MRVLTQIGAALEHGFASMSGCDFQLTRRTWNLPDGSHEQVMFATNGCQSELVPLEQTGVVPEELPPIAVTWNCRRLEVLGYALGWESLVELRTWRDWGKLALVGFTILTVIVTTFAH